MPNYKSDTNGSGKALSTFVAFAFFVLSVVALFLPDSSQDEVASLLRGSVLRPFILTQETLVRRSIHAEDTEVLQERLDSLQIVIVNSSTLLEENARLRRLLGLSERNPDEYVAATVIRAGMPGSESMFLLDVGSDQGVTRDSPVITDQGGLLGVVRRAGATSATGWDWTHPQFRASAMTEDGSVAGMVRATPGGFGEGYRLLLDGVPFQQELEPGVALVTSGLGVYPRGIPIGVVIEELDAQVGWKRSYLVRPVVSPGQATHVLVLVSEEGDSLDANLRSEDGRLVPEAAASEEPAQDIADTEARTPR
ncbi:MAG: rod shape-determining protein MreC [Gemmatimonadetes bacterium]|nr:rod shape-determining protein MreC [Gemmatimonadota bacterium]